GHRDRARPHASHARRSRRSEPREGDAGHRRLAAEGAGQGHQAPPGRSLARSIALGVVVDGGLTVLVVDGEERSRTQLLLALRRLGIRALGVAAVVDAAALLEALDADLTLVRGDDDDEALAPLRARSLVLNVERRAPLDETVVTLLRALGRPEEAASLN